VESDNWWFVPKRVADSVHEQRINTQYHSAKKFRVRFCNTCERAHEEAWEDCKSVLRYYDDFVTYGLEREACKNCK
jgi:hypothetical protein